MAQLGAPATESSPGDSNQRAVRGSRLARRRRPLFWVAGGAALLAIGGLIGASFVKSPQQIAADTAAPPATATTAKVVSQVLTSGVPFLGRGFVRPAGTGETRATASPGTEPHRPTRPADRRAEQGADRGGRGGRELHAEQRPVRVYFAVQASYEKQFVSANQQALNAGIREYKAAFAKTLKTMPTLLQTTSAVPNLPGPPPTGHHGKHGAAKPSPSHS